jgi:uncharacterized protein (UPF0332 family)
MIKDNEREILIQYRLNQSEQTIVEVDKLIESKLLNVAVNRIYYGIFYSLTALAQRYGFESSKHFQLIGWLNQNFIKSGLIEVKYGKILRDAFKNRSDGDYAPFILFEKEDVLDMQSDMIAFIEKLKSFLSDSKD